MNPSDRRTYDKRVRNRKLTIKKLQIKLGHIITNLYARLELSFHRIKNGQIKAEMKDLFYDRFLRFRRNIQHSIDKYNYAPSLHDKNSLIYEYFQDNSSFIFRILSIGAIYVYILPVFFHRPVVYLLHALSFERLF